MTRWEKFDMEEFNSLPEKPSLTLYTFPAFSTEYRALGWGWEVAWQWPIATSGSASALFTWLCTAFFQITAVEPIWQILESCWMLNSLGMLLHVYTFVSQVYSSNCPIFFSFFQVFRQLTCIFFFFPPLLVWCCCLSTKFEWLERQKRIIIVNSWV